MSDSRLYSRLLLTRGHGYPLFHPQPYDDLPLEARKNGTEIGDVGIVTSDGSFDPIFNICRAADDPLNRFGVPDGFEQVRLNPGDVAPKLLFYRPGSDVSNTKISKRRLDIEAEVEGNVFFPLGAGAVVEISTSSKATAILLLPDGASRTDLRRVRLFRDYALKHAQRWYAFVNNDLERMVESGELYLVTGVDKSSSWSVAALENTSEGCELSLKLKPAYIGSGSASCTWEWECASSFANSGPRRRPEERSWTHNQTVFLRGFKVAVRSMLMRRSSTVLSIVDSKPSDILSRGGRFSARPFSRSGRGFSRSNTGSSTSSSVTDQESSKPYHPADAINTYLLNACPNATVAVTHDDEWASVINEADGIPADAELIERICERYDVGSTSDGGAVFFEHMGSAALSVSGSSDVRPNVFPVDTRLRSCIFPEIVREDLRLQVFSPKPSAGFSHEFEDPVPDATPDRENLENLGDSVLRLVVTSLILEIYPGLRVGPASKLRDLLLDNPTLDHLRDKQGPSLGIQTRDIFKALLGALYLEQGLEAVKPPLDALFGPYLTSAYDLVRGSAGLVPPKQINTTSARVRPVETTSQSPSSSSPSLSSPDSSANHLVLFNEKKGNRQVGWVYADPSDGAQAWWSVEVHVDGEVFGRGEGNSKKAARNEAAKQALMRLGATA